jgi:exosortase/archaeosortase family protein
LVLLALPALPTAQFVLGYPLRAAAGEVAASLLGLAGFAVVREGVALRWGERLAAIDAPCSGVNMLWTALLLVLVLAALGRLSARRTALLAGSAAVLAVAGNGLRAASLFLVESGALPLPLRLPGATLHAALGVVAFALSSMPPLWMFGRWQRSLPSCAPPPRPAS